MGVYLGVPHNDYSAMQGPAPSGFHIPLTTEWKAVYDIWTALGGGSSDGTNFGIALKLPFTGYRSNSSAGVGFQGAQGDYWSSSRYNASNAYYLYFNSTALTPQSYNRRANGFSVRCFKNSPTVPTSSWTKLYGTSIEAGGIFWSSTDGLISLSSNGNTWITIQDKNLGATTVWNSGDTLSETNAGKYYQRGNNYGFPRTGSVTTSGTRVDASNYGPGSYYSSSTFITYNGRWDTTDNGNLWGGVTGVVLVPTTELKNAYIGKVIEYEWDFTDGTNTKASLQSQGWNFNGKTVSVSSSGFYHDDGRTKFSPFSLSTVKRTEIELTFKWDYNNSNSSIGYGELSGSTHNASGLWIPTYYGSKGYGVNLLGTQYKEVVDITAPGQYSGKVVIDLESGELSCSLSGYGTKSTTMNSTQINDIKQASGIMMYNYKTYIKYLKITFSM